MDPIRAEIERLRQRDLAFHAQIDQQADAICAHVEQTPHLGVARFDQLAWSPALRAALRARLQRSEQLAPHQRQLLLDELRGQGSVDDAVNVRAVCLAALWTLAALTALLAAGAYLG